MTTRIPERSDGLKTYNRLLKTTKSLFAKKGYHATSVNEIIQKSKIATGTFYQYFRSKRELYDFLVEDYRKRIFSTIKNNTKNLTNREDIEYFGLRAFLEFVNKDRLSYKIILESLFVDEQYFYDYYSRFKDSYVKQLSSSDEVVTDIDYEVMAYCLMGISNFVGIQILSKANPHEVDIDYYTKEAMKFIKSGIIKND